MTVRDIPANAVRRPGTAIASEDEIARRQCVSAGEADLHFGGGVRVGRGKDRGDAIGGARPAAAQ